MLETFGTLKRHTKDPEAKPIRGQRFGWAVVMVLAPACIDVDSLRPPPDVGSAPGLTTSGSGGVTPQGTGGVEASSGGAGGAYQHPTFSVAVADFDGDGKNESIAVDNSTGRARIFEAGGESSGSEPSGRFAGRVVFGDLDGDGSTDLAFVRNAQSGSIEVTVLLNDPVEGGFVVSRTYDIVGVRNGDPPPVLVARDLDGDGQLDLGVTGNGIDVLLNTGRGIFFDTALDTSKKTGPAIVGCPACAIVLPIPSE